MSEPAGAELLDDARQARSLLGEGLDDLLIDVVGTDGRMLWANEEQTRIVGLPPDVLAGLPVEALYAPDSADAIGALLRRADEGGHVPSCELTLIGRGGRSVRTLARPRYVDWHGRTALSLAKMDYGPVALAHAEIQDDARLLRNIVEHSTEAHWAIVFLEPVDTTQPRAEVIRQVFENQSVWRMCNRPMARLYQLPDEMDLNTRQVRLYWPRSEANERFVGQIIDANYEIDDALSVDSRHDGTPVYIRNDVRAEIVDGFLRRLWGNCRDITDQKKSESDTADRMSSMRRVFDAVPDAVIVMDAAGAVVARNRAFVDAHGEDGPLERRLGQRVRKGSGTEGSQARGAVRKGWRALAQATDGDGRAALRVHWDQVPGAGAETWNVLVLRPEDGPRRRPQKKRPAAPEASRT